jgi:hypothetical protein
MLKIFTSPAKYFETEFANIRLNKLGMVYGGLILVNIVLAFVASLITGQGFVFAFLSSVLAGLISPVLYPVVFGGIAKLLFSKDNPAFTFRDGVKVAVSSLMITQVVGVLVSLVTVVLAVVSRGVISNATNTIMLDEANAAGAAGAVALVGIFGLVVACLSLIGTVWSFVVSVIGLIKVAKANTGMALVSAILTVIAMFIVGLVVGVIVGLLTIPFAAASSLTSL